MPFVILASLITLILLDRVIRGGHFKIARDAARFKLFALRDELRRAAIEQKVKQSEWFYYLDTTLTRSISNITRISFLDYLVFALRYKEDERIKMAVENRKRAFSLPENQILAEIYNKYLFTLFRFMCERNLLFWLLMGAHSDRNRGSHLPKDEVEKVEIFGNVPATSTLLTHGLMAQPVAA
jgi:hypothetical protein